MVVLAATKPFFSVTVVSVQSVSRVVEALLHPDPQEENADHSTAHCEESAHHFVSKPTARVQNVTHT